jgi:four helix bundle protein
LLIDDWRNPWIPPNCVPGHGTFALEIIKLMQALPRTLVGEVIGKQILRSATSVGANYRAACRSQTKSVFVAKISIVVKEIDGTTYWLALIRDAELIKPE